MRRVIGFSSGSIKVVDYEGGISRGGRTLTNS